MSVYLFIDPGVKDGVANNAHAWFHVLSPSFAQKYKLVSTALDGWDGGTVPDFVVVERPLIYPFGGARPSDLMDLAWAAASDAYAWGVPVKWYYPAEWKGNLEKPIHHTAACATLSPSECAALPIDSLLQVAKALEKGSSDAWRKKPSARYYGRWTGHNQLDAVTLGLVHLGRLPFPKGYSRK